MNDAAVEKRMLEIPSKYYVEYTRQELRRLQHWFQGFKAAGGELPACMSGPFNPLHKAIRLIEEHVETKDEQRKTKD